MKGGKDMYNFIIAVASVVLLLVIVLAIAWSMGKWSHKLLRMWHYKLMMKYIEECIQVNDTLNYTFEGFLCHFNHPSVPIFVETRKDLGPVPSDYKPKYKHRIWYRFFPPFKDLKEVQELQQIYGGRLNCQYPWFAFPYERLAFLEACYKRAKDS